MSHPLPTIGSMALTVEWVGYGRPAAHALRSSVAAVKGGEPLAPVTVVVPSNHVGVAARRLLASGAIGPVCGRGTGLAAVTFLTVYRLAELLGAPGLAGAGRRPVSTPVLAAAVRACLDDAPGVFAAVAAHPATESALVASYRELRDLSEDALDAVAGASARAGDVIRLHRAARRRLEASWYDEEDLMEAAAHAIPRVRHPSGGGVVDQLGGVVVYLPQRLTHHGAALLRAVSRSGDVGVLVGATGDLRAEDEVTVALERLGVDARPPPDVVPTVTLSTEATRLVSTSDADDEVRAAVRAVVDAVRSGIRLDRVAVLHASPEPYARLLHEQLSAAGLTANGAAVAPMAASVAGRTLLDLLALPASGFRRQEVFAWLAGAPVLSDGRWVATTAWERLSRRAAVVAGRHDWDLRLTTLADDLDDRAARPAGDGPDAADPAEPDWRAERDRTDAVQARQLRAFVLGLVDELEGAAATPAPWSDHARWAQGLLRAILGGERRRAAWPVAERWAAERVELALDRLSALGAVEGPVTLDVFARTLVIELENDLGRVGRFGEGVLVASVGMGVGLDLDLVIVLGLAEGSFPAPTPDDSLLPDHEREAAGGSLALRSRRVDRQHRELLATLAGATRQVLGVPRGDLRRSRQRVPSRWALDIAGALAGRALRPDDLLEAQEPWLDHVGSFDAGVRRLACPATAQEHRLRSLMAAGPDGAGERPVAPELDDPVLALGNEVVAARRSDHFTRFDGNLTGLAVPSPSSVTMSPTRFQDWAICPFGYFVTHVLGVEVVENPEELLTISDLDRGSLVHDVLERFVTEVLARPGPSGDGASSWDEVDRDRLAAIGDECCGHYQARGLTGRAIFWRRERARILADLNRFLDTDNAHRLVHGTRPLAAELAFGFSGSTLGPVPLEVGDGRRVHFRGKADRLDVAADGTLHVVDYKTGRTRGYERLSEDDPDLRGTKLQLAVYGAAARVHAGRPDAPVRAEYWFVTSKGDFERIGYQVCDEVLERIGATLGIMVDGVEAGVFPPRPVATSTSFRVDCHPCDPDDLGVADVRRQWERKRQDPALAAYAELIEPLTSVVIDIEVERVPDG